PLGRRGRSRLTGRFRPIILSAVKYFTIGQGVGRMNDPFRRATLGSAVYYRDPMAALDWLETAFGFERTMVITDADGKLAHAEMKFAEGYIMVGAEWADYTASPASI